MRRLNLGCGGDRRADHVNLDLRAEVADVVADLRALPFPDEVFDDIRAIDVLEHFPASQTGTVMSEIGRITRSGSRLTVRVPNMMALAELIVSRSPKTNRAIRNIYGGHRWGPDGSWDAHHTGWTPEGIEGLLSEHGWRQIHNDERLNMNVEAERA